MAGPSRYRLSSIQIEYFKGFRSKRINLDADLVLVTGPNGSGKTSLVEAIEVGLIGDYAFRTGIKDDRIVSDLVNRTAKSKGDNKASVTLNVRLDNDPLTLSARVSKAKTKWSISGGLPATDLDWDSENRRKLLRDSCFLYADSFGFFSSEDSFRKKILDLFGPEMSPYDRVLDSMVESISVSLDKSRPRIIGRRKTPSESMFAVEEAENRLKLALRKINISMKPLVKDNSIVPDAGKRLLKTILEIGCEVAGSTPTIKELLNILSEYSMTKGAANVGNDLEKASAQDKSIIEILNLAKQLPPESRFSDTLDVQQQERELASLQDKISKLESEKAELKNTRQSLISSDPSDLLPSSLGNIRYGLIPLVVSALELREMRKDRRYLDSWGVPFAIPEVDESLLDRLLSIYYELDGPITKIEKMITDIEIQISQIQNLKTTRQRVARLDVLWRQLKPGVEFPLIGEFINTDAIASEFSSLAPEATIVPKEYTEIAEASRKLSERIEEFNNTRAYFESETMRMKLDCLNGFDLFVSDKDLLQNARTKMISIEFREDLNDAIQEIINCFSFHPIFRNNVEVYFVNDILNVQVSNSKRDAYSGLISLSSSQMASLALSIVIAAAVDGSLPMGFVCLDDIANSFDMNNLAADAAIIRKIAYGPGAYSRQVVITSHHEEITDRLVSLLLPPADKTMKVIEFKNWSETGGTDCVEWSISPEKCIAIPKGDSWESPIKQLWRESRAT